MSFLEVRHPMFRPLWRRILLVAVVLVWAAVEFGNGSPFWGILFAAAGLWCAWNFFVVWDPAMFDKKDET